MPESARMLTPHFSVGQPFFELFSLKRSLIFSLSGKSSITALPNAASLTGRSDVSKKTRPVAGWPTHPQSYRAAERGDVMTVTVLT
jgi:hypothetical protein